MNDEFTKLFDEVSTGKNRQDIYVEWLDYVIDINLLSLKNQDLDFEGREEYYYKMFGAWAKIVGDKICTNEYNIKKGINGWYDYLGTFYQANIQSRSTKSNSGAFYSPPNVCQATAEIMLSNNNDDYTNKLINDCCCGSGRFLLAGHSVAPEAIYIGMDLDLIAVKQACLNMYIHGITGSVLHMNSLSGEFYTGWKVNQYLNKGIIPVPHIELIKDYQEAFHYYGVKKTKQENNGTQIELNKNNKNKLNKKTSQSTLI